MPNLYHFFFFFNDTATTEIYTLSLHDALPISQAGGDVGLAHEVQQLGVVGAVAVHEVGLELPVVAETVLQVGEDVFVGAVPARPVRGRGLGGAPVGWHAVREDQRQAAPGRAGGPVGLVVGAHAERGVGREVGIDHAVEDLLARVVEVHMGEIGRASCRERV